jgi:hypothetical protein
MAFLILLSLFLTLAGSLTVAPERERQTWENLVVSPLGIPAVIRAKLACRVIRSTGIILLMLPFWIAWAYEVLTVNSAGPVDGRFAIVSIRLPIFLAWLGFRTLGHALPCVALGMLISSLCRRGRTALAISSTMVVAYGAITWMALNFPGSALSPWKTEIGSKLLLWPILPVDWANYKGAEILSSHWTSDAISDVAWLIVLPAICYVLTVWRCRRPDNAIKTI